MTDPIPVNMAEAKAEAESIVAHNTNWFVANKWWIAAVFVAFVVGFVVR